MWAKSYHLQSKCIRICYMPFYCSHRRIFISFVCFTAFKQISISKISYLILLFYESYSVIFIIIISLNYIILGLQCIFSWNILFVSKVWSVKDNHCICHAGNISRTGNFAHRLHWQKIPSYWSDRFHNFADSIHEQFGSDATIVNLNDSCNQRWAGYRWPFNLCWINVTSLLLQETSITASKRGIYSTKANRGGRTDIRTRPPALLYLQSYKVRNLLPSGIIPMLKKLGKSSTSGCIPHPTSGH